MAVLSQDWHLAEGLAWSIMEMWRGKAKNSKAGPRPVSSGRQCQEDSGRVSGVEFQAEEDHFMGVVSPALGHHSVDLEAWP